MVDYGDQRHSECGPSACRRPACRDTWDDVMERIYVRQAIEAGRRDVAEGRVVDVSEVRRRFGLSQ